MPCASAVAWTTRTLLGACFGPDQFFATSPAVTTDATEKTVPQGQDPPGADNGEQRILPPPSIMA
jgi:hypothetical protein